MGLIFTISLRNLFRQKRRNLLLGSAIAFGTMILILADSFASGISDVLFNRIMAYVSGHVSVGFTESGNPMKQVFHDGERMMAAARREVPGIIALQEAIGVMCRGIGNGKADNFIMVGIDLTQQGDEKMRRDLESDFRMVEGRFEDVGSDSIHNPVLIAQKKATYLNVKKGDVLRVRYQTINGQDQAERLTVAGIFKPSNMFMEAPIFLEVGTLKRVLGYGPHDIGTVQISIKEPRKNAIPSANKLQEALKPDIAAICGELRSRGRTVPGTVLGLFTDSTAHASLKELLQSDSAVRLARDGVFATSQLAENLGLRAGDTCSVVYRNKYEGQVVTAAFVVSGILDPVDSLSDNILLTNEKDFFNAYYSQWPRSGRELPDAYMPSLENPHAPALSREWVLLNRAKTTKALQDLQRLISKKKYRATTVDVRTMYESASAVLNLEVALKMITFVAVMVLFFIILIGVINTLRMTVRERTREIGTMRAIGMQRPDVRNSFVMETALLTLFASALGTLLGFVAMWMLSVPQFEAGDNPLGMLLVNGHLNFVPTTGSILFFNALIVAIAALTALFPARRAARLSAAAALRHFE